MMSDREFQEEIRRRLERIELCVAGTVDDPKTGIAWKVVDLQRQLDNRPCMKHGAVLESLQRNQTRALAGWGVFVVCGAAIGTVAWQWFRERVLRI